MMPQIGKWLVLFGVVMIVVGAAVWALGKAGFRGLPGDIHYESGHTRIYFPLVTCLVSSALLTAALWLWRWLNRP